MFGMTDEVTVSEPMSASIDTAKRTVGSHPAVPCGVHETGAVKSAVETPLDTLPQSMAVLLQLNVSFAQNMSQHAVCRSHSWKCRNSVWVNLVSCTYTGHQKPLCLCNICPTVGDLPIHTVQHNMSCSSSIQSDII